MGDKRRNQKGGSGLPTQMGLVFRTVAGGYLVYLAYSIYTGSGNVEGGEKIAFTAAIIAFALIGAFIVFTSLRAMQRGEYDGGAADSRKSGKEDEKEEERVEISETQRIRFGEPETVPERSAEDDGADKGDQA